MKKTQVLIFCLFLYLLSVGCMNMVHLPEFGAKIKLPELIFPLLGASWVIVFYSHLGRILKPGALEWSILAYIATVFMSAAVQSGVNPWLEAIAMLYLYGVMMIYKSSLPLLSDPPSWLFKAFTITGLFAALLGISGLILHFIRIPNLLVTFSDCYYGYFGELPRALGYMVTPNMLHNFLGICLLLYLPRYLNNQTRAAYHHLILLVLLMAIVLTVAKAIFLLAAAVLFVLASEGILHRKSPGWKLAMLFLFIICMVGTHFLIEKKTEYNGHLAMEQGCYEKEILMEAGPLIVRITNYATNKIAAVRAGWEEVPFGTGPGNFNDYVGTLKPLGLYPDYFINFDPHCTYTGAFGELGFPGLLALLWMIFEIIRALFKTSSLENRLTCQLHSGLSGCFLFIAMDAIILDTLHFRYIWILMGILAFLVERKNEEEQDMRNQTGFTSQTTS